MDISKNMENKLSNFPVDEIKKQLVPTLAGLSGVEESNYQKRILSSSFY